MICCTIRDRANVTFLCFVISLGDFDTWCNLQIDSTLVEFVFSILIAPPCTSKQDNTFCVPCRKILPVYHGLPPQERLSCWGWPYQTDCLHRVHQQGQPDIDSDCVWLCCFQTCWFCFFFPDDWGVDPNAVSNRVWVRRNHDYRHGRRFAQCWLVCRFKPFPSSSLPATVCQGVPCPCDLPLAVSIRLQLPNLWV